METYRIVYPETVEYEGGRRGHTTNQVIWEGPELPTIVDFDNGRMEIESKYPIHTDRFVPNMYCSYLLPAHITAEDELILQCRRPILPLYKTLFSVARDLNQNGEAIS